MEEMFVNWQISPQSDRRFDKLEEYWLNPDSRNTQDPFQVHKLPNDANAWFYE